MDTLTEDELFIIKEAFNALIKSKSRNGDSIGEQGEVFLQHLSLLYEGYGNILNKIEALNKSEVSK